MNSVPWFSGGLFSNILPKEADDWKLQWIKFLNQERCKPDQISKTNLVCFVKLGWFEKHR